MQGLELAAIPYLCKMKQVQFDMIAKTLFGLEQVLENELKLLGANSVKQGVRNVRFRGDTGFLYKANLCCRTALRILKPIYFDQVKTADSYYHSLSRLPWEEHMTIDTRFSIQVTQSVPMFRNTMFAAQRAKDALVDRFRKRLGNRPSVGREDPDITFFIHISPKGMEVSIDSSGKPLNQRGYRTETNIAPINEVLAAGLVTLSGWKHTSPLLDPMCGSGTLLIEAAMQACNIPSQINRKRLKNGTTMTQIYLPPSVRPCSIGSKNVLYLLWVMTKPHLLCEKHNKILKRQTFRIISVFIGRIFLKPKRIIPNNIYTS
jgi:putative N6-adenine-specific DNA methylase